MEWKARRLLRDARVRGDPAGVKRRGGSPGRPRKAKRLERKSTDMFNTALILKFKKGAFINSKFKCNIDKENEYIIINFINSD
jgi:hypothetical protein